MASPSQPRVAYGKRPVLKVIEQLAQVEPSPIYMYIPRGADPEDGFEAVSFRTFNNAINQVAHEILDTKQGEAATQHLPVNCFKLTTE